MNWVGRKPGSSQSWNGHVASCRFVMSGNRVRVSSVDCPLLRFYRSRQGPFKHLEGTSLSSQCAHSLFANTELAEAHVSDMDLLLRSPHSCLSSGIDRKSSLPMIKKIPHKATRLRGCMVVHRNLSTDSSNPFDAPVAPHHYERPTSRRGNDERSITPAKMDQRMARTAHGRMKRDLLWPTEMPINFRSSRSKTKRRPFERDLRYLY